MMPASSEVQEQLGTLGKAVGDLHDLRAAGRAADQRHLPCGTAERFRQGVQCRSGGTAIDRRGLYGDDENVVAVAATDPGASGAGLHADLETDGYTLRRTATTLPRIEALLPSIGS